MSECLYHFGIKGQRWGIRRTDEELGHVTGSGRYNHDNKKSAAQVDREDREAMALAGAGARYRMNESSKMIAQIKNDKKQHSEVKKERLQEERDIYQYHKEQSEKYLSGLSKDEIDRGKKLLQQLLDADTSDRKTNTFFTTMNAKSRADLALKHPAGSKNRSKADRYISKAEAYEYKGNNDSFAGRNRSRDRNWRKSKKYYDKYEHLSSD